MLPFTTKFRRPLAIFALAGATSLSAACAPAISTEQELQIGAQYAAELNRQLPLVQDQAVVNYINQLGNSIAQRADPRGINYRFYVVNAPEVNAFAVPGGHIYVNRGLIERSETMSELAGVLGHEIGHVVERHGLEQMARMQNTELGVNLAYILLGRQPGALEQVAVQGGASAFFATHSRAAENEADAVAVDYMVSAGIDPNGIVTMFGRLIEEQQRSPSAVEQWFSTHPLTQDRIGNVQALIARRGVPAGLTRDTREYQDFRARVRQLPR